MLLVSTLLKNGCTDLAKYFNLRNSLNKLENSGKGVFVSTQDNNRG